MGKRKQEKPTRKFQNVEFDDDEEEDYDPYYKTRTSPQQVKKPKISSPKQATPSPKTSPTRKPYPPTIGTAETSANAQQAAENLNELRQLAAQFGAQNAPRQDVSQDIDPQPDVSQDIGDKPFTCIFCGIGFTEKSMLTKHIQQVHTEQQPVDVPTDKQDQQPDAGLIPTGGQDAKPFICRVCGAGYTRKANLKKHIQTTHKDQQPDAALIPTGGQEAKPFKCSFCDKRYTSRNGLEYHLGTAHPEDRPFKCPFCDNTFTSKQGMQKHITSNHPEKQPTDNQEAKPFKCPFCDKRYISKSAMVRHSRKAHPATGSNAPAQPPIIQPTEQPATQPTLQPTIPPATPKIQKQPCYLARGTDPRLWCQHCQILMAPCLRMG